MYANITQSLKNTNMSNLKTNAPSNGESQLGLMNAKQESNSASTSGNEKIVEIIPIYDTPFTIVTKEEKSFIAIGSYKLTEETDNVEHLFELINNNNWNLLTNLIGAMIHLNSKQQ